MTEAVEQGMLGPSLVPMSGAFLTSAPPTPRHFSAEWKHCTYAGRNWASRRPS